ncbi:MAG TPA: hypothetical protein VKB75_13675 [Jatrophihabitans sp.]|nr:hypothetical protein [Jatrophihabitans sp.]
MDWWPIGAWIAAVLIALVVLGFCAYEITWKADRLRRDMARLQARSAELGALGVRLREARERAGAARPR